MGKKETKSESEFRKSLDKVLSNLRKGLDANGEPLDWSQISSEIFARNAAYAEKLRRGQAIATRRHRLRW